MDKMGKVTNRTILSVSIGLTMFSEFNPECMDLKFSVEHSLWVIRFHRASPKTLREARKSLVQLPGSW